MGALIKNYRLIWVTDTKIIINKYEENYFGSVTMHPDDGPISFFDSDDYQEIINMININGLKKE